MAAQILYHDLLQTEGHILLLARYVGALCATRRTPFLADGFPHVPLGSSTADLACKSVTGDIAKWHLSSTTSPGHGHGFVVTRGRGRRRITQDSSCSSEKGMIPSWQRGAACTLCKGGTGVTMLRLCCNKISLRKSLSSAVLTLGEASVGSTQPMASREQ